MGAVIGWILIVGIAVLVIRRWIERWRNKDAGAASSIAEPRLVPHMDGNGSYDFDIVGEASYQDALDAIAGGKSDEGHELERLATLVREPDNTHDRNAIAVLIDGRKVGYVSRKEASVIAKMMDRRGYGRFTADAMVVGGWDRGRRGSGHYGVKLDLSA